MKVLTNAEVLEHFVKRDSVFNTPEYVQGDESGLFYTHPEASCIRVPYPPELERLAFFARHMSTLGYEPWHFNSALLWVHQFGIWNSAVEGIGYRIVEQMNRAAGQPAAFETSQGHEFRADELTEAAAAFLQPMIFSWDAYYLPQWSWGTGEFFIFVSHDSYLVVVTKTKAFHEKVFSELEKMNYNPEVPPDGWCGRFCRQTSTS